MSSFFFAAQPAAHAVSRGMIGSGRERPRRSPTSRAARTSRTRTVVSRSLHRLADSVAGS